MTQKEDFKEECIKWLLAGYAKAREKGLHFRSDEEVEKCVREGTFIAYAAIPIKSPSKKAARNLIQKPAYLTFLLIFIFSTFSLISRYCC